MILRTIGELIGAALSSTLDYSTRKLSESTWKPALLDALDTLADEYHTVDDDPPHQFSATGLVLSRRVVDAALAKLGWRLVQSEDGDDAGGDGTLNAPPPCTIGALNVALTFRLRTDLGLFSEPWSIEIRGVRLVAKLIVSYWPGGGGDCGGGGLLDDPSLLASTAAAGGGGEEAGRASLHGELPEDVAKGDTETYFDAYEEGEPIYGAGSDEAAPELEPFEGASERGGDGGDDEPASSSPAVSSSASAVDALPFHRAAENLRLSIKSFELRLHHLDTILVLRVGEFAMVTTDEAWRELEGVADVEEGGRLFKRVRVHEVDVVVEEPPTMAAGAEEGDDDPLATSPTVLCRGVGGECRVTKHLARELLGSVMRDFGGGAYRLELSLGCETPDAHPQLTVAKLPLGVVWDAKAGRYSLELLGETLVALTHQFEVVPTRIALDWLSHLKVAAQLASASKSSAIPPVATCRAMSEVEPSSKAENDTATPDDERACVAEELTRRLATAALESHDLSLQLSKALLPVVGDASRAGTKELLDVATRL